MTNQTKALLAVLGAAFVGGGAGVWIKFSLKEIPPLSFTFLRFLLAYLFVLPFLRKEKIKIKNSLKPVLVSLFSTVNIVLFVFGIQLTNANMSQTIYAFVPVLTAIIAYFLIKERFNKQKVFGIVLGFIGISLIIMLPLIDNLNFSPGSLWGNLLIFTGVSFYAFYPVLSKKIQVNYSPIYLTAIFILTTAIIAGVLALFELTPGLTWIKETSLASWMGLISTAAFGTVIYYLLTQYAIKYGSAVIGTLTLYLQPFMTFFWAYLILGEKVTLLILIGCLLVIAGAYITTQTKVKV